MVHVPQGTAKPAAHLLAALWGALVLGALQILLEVVFLAGRTREFLLNPHVFFEAQAYDFCVKLFLWLPGGAHYLEGGVLDRFLAEGLLEKLALARSLVLPGLVVLVPLALGYATLRHLRHKPATSSRLIGVLVAVGLLVHLAALLTSVRMPDARTPWAMLRGAYRVLILDGAVLPIAALLLSGLLATLLLRWAPRFRWAVLVAVAVLLALSSTVGPAGPGLRAAAVPMGTAQPAVPPPPAVDNVILISIDSLRADHLGCYGYERNTSPNIDRVAAQGARFRTALSTTSWTLPSHMSMLTSRYVLSHGVIARNDGLPEKIPTLAESLKTAGFATGGVVAAAFLDARYGFARGFDSYDESAIAVKMYQPNLVAGPAPETIKLAHSSDPAAESTDLAMKWVQEHQDRRFFLFLHYWDVHFDYDPPPPYDTMFDPDYQGSLSPEGFIFNRAINRKMDRRDLEHVLALYDGEIRWVDDHLGRLLRQLDQLGLSGRTAVIITADHGDEFFEHGGKGHTKTLYSEVLHVPLIIRAPGVPAGLLVETPASQVDLMPTVLDLAGVPGPAAMEGLSLRAALRGEDLPARKEVHAWLCANLFWAGCQAMQYSQEGALIHRFQPMRIEFYGPDDFAQQRNLSRGRAWPRRSELAQMFATLESEWRAYRSLEAEKGTVKLSEAESEHLRALGYTQ